MRYLRTLLITLTAVMLWSVPVTGADVNSARSKFIQDWNKFVKKPADLQGDTIVVYTNMTQNPFRNKNDWAGEFHPRLVNRQTCKELGINFIQVRNRRSNKMLSGIMCRDR